MRPYQNRKTKVSIQPRAATPTKKSQSPKSSIADITNSPTKSSPKKRRCVAHLSDGGATDSSARLCKQRRRGAQVAKVPLHTAEEVLEARQAFKQACVVYFAAKQTTLDKCQPVAEYFNATKCVIKAAMQFKEVAEIAALNCDVSKVSQNQLARMEQTYNDYEAMMQQPRLLVEAIQNCDNEIAAVKAQSSKIRVALRAYQSKHGKSMPEMIKQQEAIRDGLHAQLKAAVDKHNAKLLFLQESIVISDSCGAQFNETSREAMIFEMMRCERENVLRVKADHEKIDAAIGQMPETKVVAIWNELQKSHQSVLDYKESMRQQLSKIVAQQQDLVKSVKDRWRQWTGDDMTGEPCLDAVLEQLQVQVDQQEEAAVHLSSYRV